MTIFDLLDRLAFLQGMPAVLIVLAAAFLATVLWDQLLVVPAVGVVYLVSGLLFVELLDPRLAVVYAIAGVFVTLSLAVTAAQINWGRPPRDITAAERARHDAGPLMRLGPPAVPQWAIVRLLLAAAALALGYWVWRGSPGVLAVFAPEQAHLRLAVVGLLALGLVGLAAPGGPFLSGVGLLLFMLGLELLHSRVEQSVVLIVALAALNLLIAAVAAYLAQARHLPVDGVE